MAASLSHDESGRKVFDLLCRLAGVDALKVRAIECRCEIKSFVAFKVELLAEPERVKSVLDSNK